MIHWYFKVPEDLGFLFYPEEGLQNIVICPRGVVVGVRVTFAVSGETTSV